MRADINRIGVAYVLIFIIAVVCFVRIIDLQFINKCEPVRNVRQNSRLECTRGSILAADGRFLAFSIPEYMLTMDPCQAADTLFDNNIDSLAIYLADFYKDRRAQQYKEIIKAKRKDNVRYLRVNRRLLTYQQMQEVSQFPILREGRFGGGCRFEKIDHRSYPYGRLGYRTLGYLKHQDSIPKVGLECSCDSVLRGRDGREPIRISERGKWIVDNERPTIPPQDGLDVQTTIDIDMQDIANTALMNVLGKTDELTAGTVVLMDVHSGEIKAMVNLEKGKNGKFDETYNYAVRRVGEPGSVFKAATLTMLLDKGLVTLDTEMDAVVSWQYGRGKPFVDNYLKKYDRISVKRGFEISSNNVFRMQAARFYGSKPQEFIDNLNNQMMITRDFPFELNGTAHAKLKNVSSKSWSQADLPQIAMGYTVEITPLHTLNFYNAIANDGLMVKPRLIRNYQQNGVIVKEFGTQEIGRVCKSETAAQVKKAMRGVVASEGGTGYRLFEGCPVEVAGKTGTARIVIPKIGRYEDASGRKMHQATFAGFFPYDSPKYSMIVVVYSALTEKNFYGATWAGPVFREIVEKVYASTPDWNEPLAQKASLPKTDNGRNLDIIEAGARQLVPDVSGLGLRDAMSYLEEQGYEVSFTGSGKVVEQVPAAGDSVKVKKINLTLSTQEI